MNRFKTFFLILLTVILGMQVSAAQNAGKIKFMDYNIMNGMWWDQYNNYERFVTWMNGQSPDILAICETETHWNETKGKLPDTPEARYLPSNLDKLAMRWGHRYVAIGPQQDNYPVAITSRYPIEVVQRIGEGLSHGALHVKIQGVNYVVIHTWPQRYSMNDKTRKDNGGDKTRYDELKKVLDLTIGNPDFKEEKYWVMTGDMNSRSPKDKEHYDALGYKYDYSAQQLMLDTYRHDLVSEFNDDFQSSVPGRPYRIDYIYCNDNLFPYVKEARTVLDRFTEVASDHYPVMMEFSIPQEMKKLKAEDLPTAVIPKPESQVLGKGVFRFTEKTVFSVSDKSLVRAAEIMAENFEPLVGRRLDVVGQICPNSISLSIDTSLEKEEYRLNVSSKGISVKGGSGQGVFHGLQTLRQLVFAGQVRSMEINDKPCFAYRGTMLDVARHCFSVEDIKTFIDMLSMHKINKFHWHLTEDQGWRIEIKKYPELTQTGAFRKETLIGMNGVSQRYDGMRYGGFYTQEEVKEVVKYAADRYIDVIPEIEMPGHGLGALSTYPWLGCTGGPYEIWTKWGISKDVYCAGKETTFSFLEDVLSEVIELFPSEYIHIGGDECPKDRWKKCSLCQERIKKEGLKNEAELQSYFMNRIEKWLNERGRKIIGWDEIYQGGISQTATIMTWRDQYNGVKAAWGGNNVIMTPKWNCYFDYSQTNNPQSKEPLCSSRYLPVLQVYRLDPYNMLAPQYYDRILGVQANVWTEYISNFGHVQHMVLPRLAALSEVGWSYDRKDYTDFERRAKELLPRLYDAYDYVYAHYFFDGTDLK